MKCASRPPLARMMAIDQAVREGRWPNATILANELEVDPRTIRRDITYMRDQLGVPLEYDSHRNGYRYSVPGYQLGFFKVTEGELVALLLAERLLQQYRGTPFESDLRQAFRKLTTLLPDAVSIRLDTLADCLAVLPAVEMAYDPAIFATLAKAVLERRCIEAVYHTADRNEATTRTLHPYSLLFRDESWYVVAWDSYRDDIRIFAVQRFCAARNTGERFERPVNFRVSDFLADSFGVVRGDETHRVILRFHPPTALRIAEKTWQRGQTLEWLPNARLILRFQVNDLREVKRWVMFWGADCEVLGPEPLKQLVKRELQQMATSL